MLANNHLIKITISLELNDELHAEINYYNSIHYVAGNDLDSLLNRIRESIFEKYRALI